MSFGFGFGDFVTLFDMVMKVRNFLKDVADAPNQFEALRAEAECLGVCLKVVTYKECRRILRNVTDDQAKDLKTIIYDCQTNMDELIGFVAQCQRIAIDSTGGRPSNTSIKGWFRNLKRRGTNLWAKFVFVWKEKQPMREKLAIPTQSLNIYLVSLTYVSLSYNTRLSGGPGGQSTAHPKWAESWNLVGQQVAFKDHNFAYADLMKPNIEDKIVECAIRIVNGGLCCEKCSKGADKGKGQKPGDPIKAPTKPRRKSSFGKSTRAPDKLYLVRSKSRTRSRSEARPSVELVTADYNFGSNSGSDSPGFDDSYLSPVRTRSPPRRFPRETPYAYAEQSSRQESSARHESFKERRESRAPEPHDEDDVLEEETMRRAERQGYDRAQEEIREGRKKAITEMAEGFVEETRASQDPSDARFSPEAGEPDIRSYIEVTYGVIIDRTPPEVEASQSRASHMRMSEEFEPRSRFHDSVADSDTSSEAESEPEIKLRVGREWEREEEVRAFPFAIPTREYTPRTEGFEGRQTSMAHRDREDSLREREMSIRDRENRDREDSLRGREMSIREREMSVREREMNLRARERRFKERQHSTGYQDMPFAYRDEERPNIIVPNRPDRPPSGRFPAGDDYLKVSPESPRRSPRRQESYSSPEGGDYLQVSPEDLHRQESYSGPKHRVQIVSDQSDDGSMYGPQRRRERATSRDYRIEDPRSGSRRSNDPDDDERVFSK